MSYWMDFIKQEAKEPYMAAIRTRVSNDRKSHKVYPGPNDIFRSFMLTPYERTKVVIIGTEPTAYSRGLAYSSTTDSPTPTVKNIYQEIVNDYYKGTGVWPFSGNDLSQWAIQGVLLLNAALTSKKGTVGSYKKAWLPFVTKAVKELNKHERNLVFMLWGANAHTYESLIDKRHLILKAPHPNPQTVHTGFFGAKHFTKANRFLHTQRKKNGFPHSVEWLQINWGLFDYNESYKLYLEDEMVGKVFK